MKKFFQKLLITVVKKFIKKSVNDVVNNPETWKFIIQTLISILTAILTALGASSCVQALI